MSGTCHTAGTGHTWPTAVITTDVRCLVGVSRAMTANCFASVMCVRCSHVAPPHPVRIWVVALRQQRSSTVLGTQP